MYASFGSNVVSLQGMLIMMGHDGLLMCALHACDSFFVLPTLATTIHTFWRIRHRCKAQPWCLSIVHDMKC